MLVIGINIYNGIVTFGGMNLNGWCVTLAILLAIFYVLFNVYLVVHMIVSMGNTRLASMSVSINEELV